MEESHGDWLGWRGRKQKRVKEPEIGRYKIKAIASKDQGVKYRYTDKVGEVRQNFIKMVDLCVHKGGYSLKELESMYIVKFYHIYRIIEQRIKQSTK